MSRVCCLLFFLLALQGYMVQGFLRTCNTQRCQDLDLFRELGSMMYMPTTEEQLNTLCPPIMNTMRCGVEAIEECTGKDIVELSTSDNKTAAAIGHIVVSLSNLIIDVCTPGSEFRENYLSIISCFKGLALDHELQLKCQQKGFAVYETYAQSKALLGDAIPDEDKESESWCMVAAYTLACFTSELHDSCGDVARQTFVHTIKRFQSLKWNECTESNLVDLKTRFLDFLELEDQRRDIFSSVFESTKKRK